MDMWSEDSSDEYVRAEQEAALYSVVHYSQVEAEMNVRNDVSNQLPLSTTSHLPPIASTQISHNKMQPALEPSLQLKCGVNQNLSKFFGHVPGFLDVLKGKMCAQSITNETQKNRTKSTNFEHIPTQLVNVSRPVDSQIQSNASILISQGSENLNSVKDEITLILPEALTVAEENTPTLNCVDRVDSNIANIPHEAKLNPNSTEIEKFSFDIKNLVLPRPVGNNLFSPFNTQYLESKTSSEKVFRLDERLFLDEKIIRQATVPSKPVSAQRGEVLKNTAACTTSINLQRATSSPESNKTEIQKAFVFDLTQHGSIKRDTSPQLNLAGTLKPKELICALTKHVIDHKIKPPEPAKITKISKKAKKKLKILQSNALYNSIANLKNPANKVMVIGLKRPETKCEVISLDKDVEINSEDPEVIVLDSDSDESVHVVPVPSAPLPVIISVEDSSDDDRFLRVRPAVVVPFETDPDVAENSFDFLDNVIENCMGDFDGIRKAQANVLSNLISNHSSKESLVDERLFQVDSSILEQETLKKATELPYQDGNVSSSTSSLSPVLQNDQSIRIVGSVESGSDTGEPKTPSHSFKVPKAKVRTKSRQARNVTNLPAVVDVTLSSSDNGKNDDDDDDILVVHSGTKSTITIEEILSGETNSRHTGEEITESEPISSSRKRKREESKSRDVSKKKKNPGVKKRAKAERMLQKFIRSQPQANLFSYTKIAGDELVSKDMTPSRSPPSWTKEMRRFYNSSWGGEDHDWKKIRASMTGHPYAWQVSNEDRYPSGRNNKSSLRCRQCQRSGHFAWACPEIRTGTKCRVCGQAGHAVKDCPNSVCLKCGQPSREFVKWCWQCKDSPFGECTKCVWLHHPAQPCKNYRERPSGVRPHLSAHAGYKGYRQRYGNNHPAERGFNPYFNKNFSRHPYR